jgi:hypothetical protein
MPWLVTFLTDILGELAADRSVIAAFSTTPTVSGGFPNSDLLKRGVKTLGWSTPNAWPNCLGALDDSPLYPP